jgi:hypothetical protein
MTSESPVGQVTFSPEEITSIPPFIHGPVLRETIAAMGFGATGSKVPAEVLDGVKGQVTEVLAAILGAYDRFVASGEVGEKATSVASSAPAKVECPTGLLYGRVQSGKTNAMIVLTAMAIDNGFRIVVVLTSDNVGLVRQTANRFQVLQGVTVKDSTAIGSWLENPDHIKASLREGGLVLVTAKNSSHLDTFLQFLSEVGAGNHPALILDDEADQATLDTTVKGKSSAQKKGKEVPSAPSKIFAHHLNMREVLRHHVYLQVTATPYALWLQNLNHPLRPKFTKLLEPGAGYTGGAFFFPKAVFDAKAPPLVFVDKDEDDELVDPEKEIPDGLEQAIGYFLVATAAQGLLDEAFKYQQQNFLCHTSFKKTEHKIAADKIQAYVRKLREALKSGSAVADVALRRGLNELSRSLDKVPSVDSVKRYLDWKLRNYEVFIINSEHDDLQLPPKMNLIVGGNILGRGMTIENLLVTYYLRSTKIAQMDTVLQHARMFGYRGKAKPYLRVFMPATQALRFVRIQQAEDALRELQRESPSTRVIPVRASKDMRPTRTNVLDASRVLAYHPGEHLYPTLPYTGPKAAERHREASKWLKDRFGIIPGKGAKPIPISIQDVLDAVAVLPFDETESGNWDPVAITSVLSGSEDIFKGRAFLYARTAVRNVLSEGMLGSHELKSLRTQPGPVLCVFEDHSGLLRHGRTTAKGPSMGLPFYVFPELVLPKGEEVPVHVFNDS